MERTDFTDLDAEERWWLIADEIERELDEPRKDLSSALGYSRDELWFQDRTKVENLYDILNSSSSALLTELDQAIDLSTRTVWLQKVIELLSPAEDATEETQTEAESVPMASAEPVAAAAPAAPAKVSPFAKKQSGVAIDSAVEQVLSDVDLSPESIAGMLEISVEEARELAATIPDNLAELLREQVRQQTGA